MMKTSMRRVTTYGALMGLTVLAGCSGGEAEAAEDTGPNAAAVGRTNLRITAEATGAVEPILTVEVKSKASGEVLQLHVDTGDRVEQGRLLAEVDPRDVRNAYEQAEADLEVAQSRRQISEAQLQRSQELLEAGVITRQEHEGKDLEFANARAALVRAQTNLELARLRLGDVTIQAPTQGTIIQRSVEVGTVIQSASGNISGGTTLFQMANLDSMQVRTLVDETDVGQLQAGMQASVTVEAFPDRTFTGTIEKIEPQAEVVQNVTMFPVIVQLDNRAGLLRPGMNAEVEVLIAERLDVLTVPNGAVVEPRQVAPAAEILGVDLEAAGFDMRTMFAGRRGQGQGMPGGREADGDGASPRGAPGSTEAAGPRRGGGMAAMAELTQEQRAAVAQIRRQARDGSLPADSAQVRLAAIVGDEAAQQMAAFIGGGGRPGAQSDASAGQVTGRRAVVFVVNPDGSIEPRGVLLGIGDWDQTEVLSGLEEGERVAQIGAAQLQARQQEFLNRIRSRNSGPLGGR